MKRSVVVLLLMGATVGGVSTQGYDPDWFQKLNPDYAKKSGKFYETKYLPDAAKNMAKAAGSPALAEQKAAALLKDHIDSFLEQYVAGNGSVTRAELAQLVQQLDQIVQKLLKDDKAFQGYLKWRKTTSRDENPLEFLFNHSFTVTLKLSDELMMAGWSLNNITDVNQLVKYQKYAGFAPDQVLHFDNKKEKKGFLTVLVYPIERLSLLKAGKGPNPKGKLDPSLQPFWDFSNHVLYALEGDWPQGQAKLAAFLRAHFLGDHAASP